MALFLGHASAQTPSGTISGRVVDATGLALPGVTVEVQGVDITQTFVTDAEGHYRFLELAPGTYKVTRRSPASRPPSATTSCSISARRSTCL
jgi:protocatechuate 3,4-dioxygenase beta subunit